MKRAHRVRSAGGPAGVPRVFWLLALVNVLVGAMVGLERTVVPLLGSESFGLEQGSALAMFVISFGLSKAVFNVVAGVLADRIGRRRVLLVGWLLGLPIAPLLIWAPSWNWIIAANVLLGVQQALTWSMTVNIMVDLVPATRRGFAAGINEFSGYLGVSLLAFLTGVVAFGYGLRPAPFLLGVGVSVLGLALSLMVRETAPQAKAAPLAWVPGIGAASLLGGATNLKDGLLWLALPLMMSARGSSLAEIGVVAGLYPLVWAAGQLVFGPLSDRLGRRPLILTGMLLQGAGLVLFGLVSALGAALLAALLLGLGTAMVYPTLIALVADRAPAQQRATALGIYRFVRDGGYAAGAAVVALGGVALPSVVVAAGGLLVLASALLWRRL